MLRNYQQDAVAACYSYLQNNTGNPCIVLPTGAGKTHVIRQIVSDAVDQWGGRVLVLAHVKELLQQAADKLDRPDVGIYSAGLNSRDTKQPIIIAGIQSVYSKADKLGAFNLILIDEAHLLPPDGEGMYQTFMQDALVINPSLRLVGLTATPYRLSTGAICGPDNLLNDVCYEASIPDLIVQGFLSPVRSKQSRREVDLSDVHVRGGEFIESELQAAFDTEDNVSAACDEVKILTRDRTSILIFTSGVRHAMHVSSLLPDAEIITGDTSPGDREDRIKRFRNRELRYLVNVNVLTTGFDAPNVDAIAMMRATMSPGLYYQMVGRGLRLSDGKRDCLVLDYGGNVKRHGPIDQIRAPKRARKRGERSDETAAPDPTQVCPQCQEIIPKAAEVCPECGHEFPAKHDSKADETPILSVPEPPRERVVTATRYAVHHKKDAPPGAPRTLRVDYICGLGEKISEWVCVEHEGFAGEKARAWWSTRSHDPFPADADHAVAIANAGGLAETSGITTIQDGRYERVKSYIVGERPTPTLLLPGEEATVDNF